MGKKAKLKSSLLQRKKSKLKSNIPVKQRKQKRNSENDILKKGIDFSKQAVSDKLFSLSMDYDDNEVSHIEREYEIKKAVELSKKKNLLPIKTKEGIVPIVQVEENTDLNESDEDEGIESSNEEVEPKVTSTVTATELLLAQSKRMEMLKIQIGSLCAGILENPNEKLSNFQTLFNILKDESGDYLTLKKLLIVSVSEVFKDLLPSYQIKQTLDKTVKLKKETLRLEKFETSLLQYYKKFLQILERTSAVLRKKHKSLDSKGKLAEIAVSVLCELLLTHPYFNYAENIAQTVIPFLNHSNHLVREKVQLTCKNIFKDDLKGEITLKIVRLINQAAKKFSFNIHTEMLEVLLHLKIRDINISQERENILKQKKLMSHKGNLLRLSKNEKKKKIRLKEVETALMEAKAEENKQSKQKNFTEIIKLTFGVFFKILKNSNNSKIVGISLQGIAKYAHCINVEFYVDLINILDQLLKTDWLNFSEQQRCIQTIFIILGEQDELLNLDPSKFYASLYERLLTVHASRNYDDFAVLLDTLIHSLVKRQKKISTKRMASFLKRIMTLSLQLLHNGTLSCLSISKSLLQSNRMMDILLDLESSTGDGLYLPELNDPEYCNASSTALYELTLLRKHYHPTIVKYSKYVAAGTNATADDDIIIESRALPDQLYQSYDMLKMSFFPVISAPKKAIVKAKLKKFHFCDNNFKQNCIKVIKNHKNVNF